jgi:hypothetical protein
MSRHPGESRDPAVLRKYNRFGDATQNPVWRSRASQGKPGKARACLSVIERSEIASCASAGFTEKHRRSGHKSQIYARTSHRVPFSLGTFSWASKRKYLARGGETCAKCKIEVEKCSGDKFILAPLARNMTPSLSKVSLLP